MTLPAPSVQADYFDGRSSRRQSVSLRLEGGRLHLAGEQIERLAPLAELRLSEPMGSAPRLITFPDGAYCEVRDVAGLSCLLQASGQHDSWIVRWQFDLRAVALAAVLCMLCGVAGYLYGLPWISARLAEQIPTAAVNSISTRLLAELDKEFLAPSRLSEARQAEISRRFAALQTAEEHTPAYEIVFRANRRLPANAFALPSGTLILTDDLVKLARTDNQLRAVLAHELGHVQARHGLRLVIQSSLAGLFVAWFVGDVSSIVAAAPTILIQAKYSRDLETEADDFARRMLQANGLSPSCLGEMLVQLEQAHARKSGAQTQDYLSSHPAGAQRHQTLAGPACE